MGLLSDSMLISCSLLWGSEEFLGLVPSPAGERGQKKDGHREHSRSGSPRAL